MKLTKNDLKEIVKECLVEILSEGMGLSTTRLKENLVRREQQTPVQRRPSETVSYGAKQPVSHPSLDKRRINDVIKAEAKGDPVLAAILADTASTTLPNMLMNENNKQINPPAGTVESIVALNSPEDLFGDAAASKWAALAFMDTPKKF